MGNYRQHVGATDSEALLQLQLATAGNTTEKKHLATASSDAKASLITTGNNQLQSTPKTLLETGVESPYD